MCFNAQVSLATYVICLGGCYLLWRQNKKPEAIVFAWIIQMQLIEFFIWQNQPCNEGNLLASRIGLLLHNTQPMVFWLAIICYSKRILPDWIHRLIGGYLVFTLIYTVNTCSTLRCTTVTTLSQPHLHWKWTYGPNHLLYYATYFTMYLLLTWYGIETPYYMLLLYVVSYVITWAIYKETHAVGSMWCFIGAFAPWVLSLLYQL